MKYLLLLLAVELVSSDKLDRTYLPPPGAKYSGGTLDDLYPPLENPKRTEPGAVQNGLVPNIVPGNSENREVVKNGFPSAPLDYVSSPKYDGYFNPTPFSNDFVDTSSEPGLVFNRYNNFPSTFPSTSYLPSKPTSGTESYIKPNTFYATTSTKNEAIPGTTQINPVFDEYDKRNNYFVPATETTRNNINVPKSDDIQSENVATIQYPNQNIKNREKSFFSNKYQPEAFGLYGGSPMIMTIQNKVPQNVINNNNVMSNSKFADIEEEVKLYQTPLAGTTNELKSDTNSNPSVSQFQLPTATIRSFPKEDASSTNRQRNENVLRRRYKLKRPQAESDRNALIVNYDNNISPGGYSYSFDTSNGIHVNETATTTNGVRAKGFYSYTGDDGKVYTVTYTADENGFRPQGDHLPTPPPVPDAIKKVIEQAEREKAAGIIDDGSYDERKYGYMNYENGFNKYLPIKKSDRKSSMVINSRKPINGIPITDVNKLVDVESPSNTDKDIKMQKRPRVNTNRRSGLKQNEQVRGQNKIKYRRPNTSVSDDQFAAKNSSNEQNMNLPITTNPNNVTIKPQTISQFGPTLNFNGTGYYYVPPVNTFNPYIQNPSTRKPSNVATVEPTPYSKTKMRYGFDVTKEENNKNNEMNTTPLSKSNNRDVTTTRKPYISGPEIQDNLSDPNSRPESSIENVNANEYPTFPLDQPSSQYIINTTPMTVQAAERNRPEVDYPQYYQSSTSPALFDPTLPETVVNRVNLPSDKPGITVSQDFTTTIRPETFRDGVLEVKQNVKIYGIGSPEITKLSSENNFGYDNDVLYPKSSPNIENSNTGASTIYPGPEQNTGIFQEIPNPNRFNGNEYTNTEEANARNGDTSILPETNYDASSDQNSNSKPENEGYTIQVPEIPFSSPLENYIPGQDLLNVGGENQNPDPNSPFGEDFSGPKQAQKFDPVHGYYYK